ALRSYPLSRTFRGDDLQLQVVWNSLGDRIIHGPFDLWSRVFRVETESQHHVRRLIEIDFMDPGEFLRPSSFPCVGIALPATHAGDLAGHVKQVVLGAECLLRLDTSGDVPCQAQKPALALELEASEPDRDGERGSVLAAVCPVRGEGLIWLNLGPGPPRAFQAEVLLDVLHIHPEELRAGISQALAGPFVDIEESTLEIMDAHRVRGLLHIGAEFLLAGAKRFLSSLALRDL